ncbi:MAG TPA: NAD(P)/FAD-dependent oxidoreductase [Candidatus Latescibacteria bacterium]|nr:NAD(P)/FAD-dependent oxidoreductase [Candidatus Latescibacterota bacterium]
MNYVIIGNSTAGVAAIEAIRECDKDGRITVISDEPYANYSRPLISYLLAGLVSADKMPYRTGDFYKDNRVELILSKRADRLDLETREVILQDGKRVPFDRLLIATGGIPIVPEIKGINLNGIFTFTRWIDAERIKKYIEDNGVEKALVVGGGLIGLKATEALMELGIKVTIVELADRILSATFDKKASKIIEDALSQMGCRLITSNTVVEFSGEGQKVEQALLRDEETVPADLVIIAIGVRPNVELPVHTPIKVNRGILVDDLMQTSVKDVYAAGDCCEARDALLNINRPIAIWPNASRQGKIAGYNMAGVRREYRGGFAMNSVELCGIPTISVGTTDPSALPGTGPEGEYEVLDHLDENRAVYKKLVLRDNTIVGAIFINDIDRAGIYTGLISDKVDVSSFRAHLLKEDFGLISLPKEYRKHLVTGEAIEI